MQVLRARASDLEQEFAFGVVRQLFEGPLDRADPETRPSLFRGAAALASPLFDLAPVAAAGGRYIEDSGSAAATAGGRPAGDLSFTLVHGLYWLTNNLSRGRAGDDRRRRRPLGRRVVFAVPGLPERAVRGARRARRADRARGRADREPRGAHHPAQRARCDPGDARLAQRRRRGQARAIRARRGRRCGVLLSLRACERRQSVPAARADPRARRRTNRAGRRQCRPGPGRASGRGVARRRWRGWRGSAPTRACLARSVAVLESASLRQAAALAGIDQERARGRRRPTDLGRRSSPPRGR